MKSKYPARDLELLVQKAQKGDSEALEKIYEAFYKKIFIYISFRVDPGEVDDLVADVFLRLVAKLKTYKYREKFGFNAWIFRIAHNRVVDFYRKQKELYILDDDEVGEKFHLPSDDEHPLQKIQREWEAGKIREILSQLSPLNREIIELKFLEDFSNYEISHITGKSEGNIRVIQLRALRELRKYFGEKEG